MTLFKAHRSHRIRRLSTIVTVTGPGTLKCGLCKRELTAPYHSGIPGPCGCDWLWYGPVLAAFPSRAASQQRALARNRRRAQAQKGHST